MDDLLELDPPACADGIDNDMDGLVDYPLDPGCASILGDDETAPVAMVDAGPSSDGGDMATDAGTPGSDGGGVGRPPDLGGVDDPGDGCACRATQRGGSRGGLGLLGLMILGVLFLRRRSSLRRP